MLNNRAYSDKQKLTRACATIPKSPKNFLADAKIVFFSSRRPQGLPKSHICRYESCSILRAAQLGELNLRLSSIRFLVRANKRKDSRRQHSEVYYVVDRVGCGVLHRSRTRFAILY